MKHMFTIIASFGVCVALADDGVKPLVGPPAPVPKQPVQPEPSLDELLGLPSTKPAATVTPAPDQPSNTDPAKRALDRDLKVNAIADDFLLAVDMMQDTASRLVDAKDPGAQTQRIQDEIIKRLDKVIDDAKKNQQKQQQKQSGEQQNQDQSQQQQSKQQQKSQQQRQAQSNDSNAQAPGVPRQDAVLKPPPAGAAASWGNLPPRVRDALMQGYSDKFSGMYERMTQEYYKRLAEPRAGAMSAPTPPALPPTQNPGSTER